MKHALSIAVSALIFAVVSGTAQAAPITSLPAGISTDASAANITPVHYRYWNRHHHYGYHSSYWNYYRVDWPGEVTTRNRPDKAPVRGAAQAFWSYRQ